MLKKYIVEKLDESSVDEAARFIADVFLERDSLGMMDAEECEEFRQFLVIVGAQSAKRGFGLIARCRDTNQMVGAVISDDLADTMNSGDAIQEAQEDPFVALVHELNKGYLGDGELADNQYFSIKFIATAGDFIGQGLISDLITQMLEIASANGFDYAQAEASGPASQHVFINKFGFEEKNSITFNTFVYGDEKPFAEVGDDKNIKLVIKSL